MVGIEMKKFIVTLCIHGHIEAVLEASDSETALELAREIWENLPQNEPLLRFRDMENDFVEAE
jgi:hypothetical protein